MLLVVAVAFGVLSDSTAEGVLVIAAFVLAGVAFAIQCGVDYLAQRRASDVFIPFTRAGLRAAGPWWLATALLGAAGYLLALSR